MQSMSARTILLWRLVQETGLVVERNVDLLHHSRDRRKLPRALHQPCSCQHDEVLTMSEAAFTLSTAPIWSAQTTVHQTSIRPEHSVTHRPG